MSKATRQAREHILKHHAAEAVIIMVLDRIGDKVQASVTLTGTDAHTVWLLSESAKIIKAEIGEERFEELTEILP